MFSRARTTLVQRLPGVGWRTELLATRADQVTDLRAKVADLRTRLTEEKSQVTALQGQLARERDRSASAQTRLTEAGLSSKDTALPPSFRRHLLELRRGAAPLRALDPDVYHPAAQIPRKLRNYRLAASHGIATPTVLGSWIHPEEIDLTGLPEQFVLKCEIGSSGNAVFPLRRLDEGRYVVSGSDEVHTRESLVRALRSHTSAWGPYFVEEFLTQRVAGEEILDDIKVYACYGRVVMVLLRQMPRHADLRSARYRYLDADGEDLGVDIAPDRAIHASIPRPEPWGEFMALAAHLSRAVALPFIRVDIYDTDRGPVLGELTRSPGGSQRYRLDQDQAMGRAWDEAQWRLELDVIHGRPLRNLHGLHPVPDVYPAGHASHRPDPKGWEMVRLDCAQWCFGGHLPVDA